MVTRPAPDYASGMWAHIFAPRAEGERRYWLVKSEPDVFSWEMLGAAPGQTMHWDGVRNFSARNFMLDGMALGDEVFFYHSSADPQAIVGVCEVARLAYPDHTQFDPTHSAHDADAKAHAPTWWMVDLRAVVALPRPVTLAEIKRTPTLAQMALIRVGRLSVVPVTREEWVAVLATAATAPSAEPAKKPASKKSASKQPASKKPASEKPPSAKRSATTSTKAAKAQRPRAVTAKRKKPTAKPAKRNR